MLKIRSWEITAMHSESSPRKSASLKSGTRVLYVVSSLAMVSVMVSTASILANCQMEVGFASGAHWNRNLTVSRGVDVSQRKSTRSESCSRRVRSPVLASSNTPVKAARKKRERLQRKAL